MVFEELEEVIEELFHSLVDTRPKEVRPWRPASPLHLSEQDITKRTPIWQAISDLWLAQELEDYELRSIAWALAQSDHDWQQLEEIYLFEVAPVVHGNLRGGSGVWGSFDILSLREAIAKNLRNPLYAPEALNNREGMTELVADDWKRIREYFIGFRSPPG